MKTQLLLALLMAVAGSALAVEQAAAGEPRRQARAAQYSWHGAYAHQEYGTPVALVVPPTASLQTHYGWGVGNSGISRINHQFGRAWPGYGGGAGGFAPTPLWPSHTDQFGVYYVRAPWR